METQIKTPRDKLSNLLKYIADTKRKIFQLNEKLFVEKAVLKELQKKLKQEAKL